MGLTSLQVCMDSSDWLQGTISEEAGLMDSSSPSGGDNNILACSRPLMERRLRPQHDQALKCPRCDSTHTKFCYYNNYSLSQPRYFCKTCRRYWTKGGTLRNIPVGGGCRKNKKVSNTSKKSNSDNASAGCAGINYNPSIGSSSSSSHHQYNPTDLHLSFPEIQFSQLSHMFGNHQNPTTNFMEAKCNAMFDQNNIANPRAAIEFVEGACKYDDESHFLGSGMIGGMNTAGDHHMGISTSTHGLMGGGQNFHHGGTMISSPFAMTLDGINNGSFIDTTFHRGSMLSNYQGNEEESNNMIDVKPNTKLLSLEWPQDHHQDVGGKESFGYVTGLGSWAGLMNGYGPSTTNPLV